MLNKCQCITRSTLDDSINSALIFFHSPISHQHPEFTETKMQRLSAVRSLTSSLFRKQPQRGFATAFSTSFLFDDTQKQVWSYNFIGVYACFCDFGVFICIIMFLSRRLRIFSTSRVV